MRLSTTSATILVVADDPRVSRAMCTTLSSEGCSMVEATSGGEALVKLRNDRPDLIILDLMSEPRDLACREIRSASDVPIIVLTSRNTEQEKVMTLDKTSAYFNDIHRAEVHARSALVFGPFLNHVIGSIDPDHVNGIEL